MYESKRHPPIPRVHFIRRLLGHFLAAIALLATSLFAGMAGSNISNILRGVTPSLTRQCSWEAWGRLMRRSRMAERCLLVCTPYMLGWSS